MKLHRVGLLAALVLAAAVGLTGAAEVAPVGEAGAAGAQTPRLGPELDVTRPVLTGASGEQTEPRAAWDGKQFLVTWRSSFWKDELRATRVSASGQVLDGRGVPVAVRERNAGSAPVAAGGGGFLVAWVEDPSRVMVARAAVEPALAIGPAVTVFEGAEVEAPSDPAVAFADSLFWVVWSRQSAPRPVVVAAPVTVDAAGAARPRDGTPVELGAGFGPVAASSEAGGSGAWALWGVPAAAGDMVELRLARLAAAAMGSPAVGAQSRLLLMAAGVRVEHVALAQGGGQRAAAATIVRADGTRELRVTRFDADGQALDATALPLAVGPRLRGAPALAWNGQSFIVHWTVETDVAGRVTPVLQSSSFPPLEPPRSMPAEVSGAGKLPVLVPGAGQTAGAGGGPMLFWEEIVRWSAGNDPADSDIRALPLAALAPSAVPTVVSLATNWQSEPAIAWSGVQGLVAFEDGRQDKAGADIHVARLTLTPEAAPATGVPAAGELRALDGDGVGLATGPASQRAPAVAWDGREFVVVWLEGAAGLALARVSEEGAMVGTPQRVPGTQGHALLAEPVLCRLGEGTLLVWAARRTATASEMEIWGVALASGAPAAESASFLLTRTADTSFAPVLRLGCHPGVAALVWSGLRRANAPAGLHLGRILPGGRGFDPQPGIATLAEQVTEEWAGIATNGHEFLVAWRAFNERNQRTVFAGRLSADGRLLDPRPVAVGQSNSGRRVTALWDGAQFLVMAVNTEGGNPFELRARRLSASAAGLRVLDPDWFRVATLSKPWGGGGAGAEGVSLSTGRTLLVYEQYPEDDASSNPRIRARVLDTPVRVLPAAAGDDADGGTDGGGRRDGGSADVPDRETGNTRATGGSGCHCQVSEGHRAAPPAALWLLALLPLLWPRPPRPRSGRRQLGDPAVQR